MDLVKEINDFYYHMALYELQVMNGNDYYNGLSYNSLLYINVMEQMEECTVSKMADVLKITKSAVTLKINELVKQGVVVKKQSEKDKRVYFLELSPHLEQIVGVYDQVYYSTLLEFRRVLFRSPRYTGTGKKNNGSLYPEIRSSLHGHDGRYVPVYRGGRYVCVKACGHGRFLCREYRISSAQLCDRSGDHVRHRHHCHCVKKAGRGKAAGGQ